MAHTDVATAARTLGPMATVLKNQLPEVTKTVTAHDQQMTTLARETERGFEQERSEREKANRQIREALHANAPLEIAGALLIAIGIILSAAASFL
jgi:hypothetical protein